MAEYQNDRLLDLPRMFELFHSNHGLIEIKESMPEFSASGGLP